MLLEMVSKERLRALLRYSPETGLFYWRKSRGWAAKQGGIAGTPNVEGYVKIRIDGQIYAAHRLAWLYVYGGWPAKQIDHINGDKADNRVCNLREVTQVQNSQNRKKNATTKSGYKGVSWRKNRAKWKARIRVNGRLCELGDYDTPEEAHAAYIAAAKEHFGEYARIA